MRNVQIFLAASIFGTVLSLPLAAQTASVSGVVKDPSGGLVSTATVKLKDTAKGAIRTTQSDAGGGYLFALLAPGEYEFEVSAAGFETIRQTGLVLQVDERQRIDFTMQVGAVTTTVEITGTTTGVQTETGLSVGAVIENKRVMELPLNGRNFIDLAFMAPGTYVPNTSARLGTAFGLVS